MNTVLNKIVSLNLVLLVLLSTFSVTIEKHFCGDFLVDVAYFVKSKGCADMNEASCDDVETIKKKNCCKDEIEQLQGQDNLKKESLEKLTFEQQEFLMTFVYSYINTFKILAKHSISFRHYRPPNLIKDIHILHEVFII